MSIRLQEQSKKIRIIQVSDISKRIIETNNTFFPLRKFQRKKIEKELKNLLSSKAAPDSDIPAKVIKGNIDIFSIEVISTRNISIVNETS